MKHIVVDLEMNSIAKCYRQQAACLRETIEIGAVLLDEQYQEIGAFKTLVKPQYNEVIEPYFEKLTGIRTEMVESAPIFEDALHMFLSWCKSIQGDIRIYQWSEADLLQLTQEIAMKDITLSKEDTQLLATWHDFQKEYGDKLGIDRALSLKDAILYAGIEFEGTMHDALFDARNTAHLLEILRDPAKCSLALGNVLEALHPTSVAGTLGEMFDFGKLKIGA